MPWKTVSLLKVRQCLVEAVLARRQTLQAICRRFGISRKTAYQWRARFLRRGRAGLRDRSRRPHRSPTQLSGRWIQLIGQWRRRRPHWGAKKIHHQLHPKYPRAQVPARGTIQRWLQRLGWVRARAHRARRGPSVPHPGLTVPPRPNQVGTVDFKGWFRTADGVRQEPLTIRDLFSRYGLCLRLLPNQDDRPVRRTMQRLFRRRGLLEAIRVDTGSPFGGTGALGLSRRRCGGCVWGFGSSSFVGRDQATTPGTNNFTVPAPVAAGGAPVATREGACGSPNPTASFRLNEGGSGTLSPVEAERDTASGQLKHLPQPLRNALRPRLDADGRPRREAFR